MCESSRFVLRLIFWSLLSLVLVSGQERCTVNQINCINCRKYQICDGQNYFDVVTSCDSPDGCGDPQFEMCRLLLNCHKQNGYALDVNQCTQVGVFSDNTSESNFYVCLDDTESGFLKFEFSCLSDEFFDNSTLQCMPKAFTLSETSTTSEVSPTNPVIEMTTSPSTAFVSSVTSASNSPTQEVSTESSTAQPEATTSASDEPSTGSPTESSNSPAVTSSTTPGSQTTSPVPPFACTSAGVFAHPTNCKMYFRCSTSLLRFDYVCPGISYFDEVTLKCSLTVSPACQEQITQNSTTQSVDTSPTTTSATPTTEQTTPEPTTTQTTPPTTAKPLTTTTTTASVPTSSVKTPFKCSMPGVFPNPLNCKTYFRCSESGRQFTYACPGDTYFNEITKTCSLTVTPFCQRTLAGTEF